jgi:hypothetical protein
MTLRCHATYSLLALSLFGFVLHGRSVLGQGVVITAPSPSVIVKVEPEENGKVVYAPIAAATSDNSGAADGAHLALTLLVTNTGSGALHLRTTTVTFAGPPFAAGAVFNTDAIIPPGVQSAIHVQENVAFPGENFNFKLSYPPPPGVILKLKFDGYNAPVTVSRLLAAHRNAPAAGEYTFPGKVADLNPGEFWYGSSNHITGKHGGNERFAYDMGVRKWDPALDGWSRTKPGTDGSRNEHWLVWEKPLYALADGTVHSVTRGHADHEPGGDGPANQILIRVGDEVIHYLHLRQNTIPIELEAGDPVSAGQFLGRVGDTGNSSNPHLHIDVVKRPLGQSSSYLRPLLFGGIKVIQRSELDPYNVAASPWVSVGSTGKSVPWEGIAIWPATTTPGIH